MKYIKKRERFINENKDLVRDDALDTLAAQSDGQPSEVQEPLKKLDSAKAGSKVVTRFAPSPTGFLHIGGLRTALYNYLFAKKHGGIFYLRVEDTDQKRYVGDAEKYIKDALEWLGIEPDYAPWNLGPEPYNKMRQSERDYSGHIKTLMDSGFGYYAFDTTQEMDAARAKDKWFSYGAKTRMSMKNSLSLPKEEVDKLMTAGAPYVIRFKLPEEQDVSFNDIIRGNIKQNTKELDDKVLIKSTGIPTYHFANVCDDHDMGTTHVIRGEEWISSTPLHTLLYKSMGWEAPQYAHLPLLLNPDGKGKLSKRKAFSLGIPVFPMGGEGEDDKGKMVKYKGFKDEGYYAEALRNFLLMLGWAPSDDRELFSLADMISEFDLSRVHKSGAKFEIDKAKWYNQNYMQEQDDAEILRHVDLGSTYKYGEEKMKMIIDIAKKRSTFPGEINTVTDIFFKPVTLSAAEKELASDDFKKVFTQYIEEIDSINWDDADDIKQKIYLVSKANGIGMGKVMRPLRQAIADGVPGPDLPITMQILGKEECIKRIQNMMN